MPAFWKQIPLSTSILSLLLLFTGGHQLFAQQSFLKEINEVAPPAENNGYLIENVRILDGHGGQPIEQGYVLVKKGKITAVGAGKPASNLRNGVEIQNGEGKTIIPGLIDAHLHTVNDNELIRLFLNNGVTSMRDPGHPFSFYQSIAFAEKPLPRIFLTGAHLDYPPVAYGQQATLVKSSGHAREMVQQYVKNGASAIKIYFRLPLEFYPSVITTAKQHRIPVTAHLELVRAVDAIEAGVNGIEHVTSFGTSVATDPVRENFLKKVGENNNARGEERYRLSASLDMNSPKIKEAIDYAVSKQIVLCPTLAAFEKQGQPGKEEDFRVKGFKNMIRFVEMAHKAGLKIVIGSHSHVEYAKTGEAYFREMELLEMAGMTPLEILRAGTVDNADFFGNQSRLGSIEKGKAADLVLINGNPSENLQDMRKIEAVMLNGNWVQP